MRSDPREIRDRPRVNAEIHLPHGRAQELAAGLVHRAVVAHLGRTHTCTLRCPQGKCRCVRVGGQTGALPVLDVGKPRGLDPRPDRGRELAAALVVDAIDESFWNGTRGTSTWMSTPALACGASVRSSSGSERRFW